MPKLNFSVSKSLLEDLRQLSAGGSTPLDNLSGSLDGNNACLIKPSDLRAKFLAFLGPEMCPVVERVVLGLATFRRQSGAATEDVFEVLIRAVENSEWDEPTKERWLNVQSPLRELLDKPSINTTAKAVDLLYDYDAFFSSGNILTDIRPVFDENRGSIVGATVNHTLRLAYSDAVGKRTDLSLILDLDDIQKLKKACDDALQKGGVILEELRTKWRVTPLTMDEIKNDRG